MSSADIITACALFPMEGIAWNCRITGAGRDLDDHEVQPLDIDLSSLHPPNHVPQYLHTSCGDSLLLEGTVKGI